MKKKGKKFSRTALKWILSSRISQFRAFEILNGLHIATRHVASRISREKQAAFPLHFKRDRTEKERFFLNLYFLMKIEKIFLVL